MSLFGEATTADKEKEYNILIKDIDSIYRLIENAGNSEQLTNLEARIEELKKKVAYSNIGDNKKRDINDKILLLDGYIKRKLTRRAGRSRNNFINTMNIRRGVGFNNLGRGTRNNLFLNRGRGLVFNNLGRGTRNNLYLNRGRGVRNFPGSTRGLFNGWSWFNPRTRGGTRRNRRSRR